MEDKVFGTLSFNHGWIKREVISFWGSTQEVTIRTSSYKDQIPSEAQQKAYQDFKEHLQSIDEESMVKVAQFMIKNDPGEISSTLEAAMTEVANRIKPFEVLFFQDGSYAIECEDEHTGDDISILKEDGKMKVGNSDELLGTKI